MTFLTSVPLAFRTSPQSPAWSIVEKLRKPSPLQHAAVVLVVEEVLVVDEVDEVDEVELLDVDDVDDVDVDDVDDVDEDEVDEVDDVDVDEVEVDEVDDVDVDDVDVVVVPSTEQAPGAGASFRLSSSGRFLMVEPPNSAQ